MPETPEAFWQRTRGALRMPKVEEWETWPFDGELAPRELVGPVPADAPRSGAGGVGCRRCAEGDAGALWSDAHWLVRPLDGPSGLPAVVILETRAHYDFPDLPSELQEELGPLLVRVQRAVSAIGTSATCTSAVGATGASTATSGSWRAPRASRS